jgi:hypothetical protein
VRSPILPSGGVDGENIEFGRTDRGVVHHDQAGLKGGKLTDIVSAQDFQLARILRIWGGEKRSDLRVLL